MNTFSFYMALLMGLTGSLHCVGMCGPIMLVMPFQALNGLKKWLAIALYHLGRISVYATMAVILYSFKGFFDPHVQRYISIALGIALLLTGIFSFLPGKAINLPWTSMVRKHMGRFIGNPSISSLFFTGVLNGLLPCGLVYMALSASVTASNPLHAAMLMYIFGIGTLPALISITVLKNRTFLSHSRNLKKLVPVALFVFGGLLVVRGMNLGIPYVSPKIAIEHNEVKASCCHKK